MYNQIHTVQLQYIGVIYVELHTCIQVKVLVLLQLGSKDWSSILKYENLAILKILLLVDYRCYYISLRQSQGQVL